MVERCKVNGKWANWMTKRVNIDGWMDGCIKADLLMEKG